MDHVNVTNRLIQLAADAPERRLITFIDDSTLEHKVLTSKMLVDRAQEIAFYLHHHLKLKKGERVVLCYPQGLEFVEAFTACQFAGLIPVPVAPPISTKAEALAHYQMILKDAKASAQLTCARFAAFTQNIPWVVTDLIQGEKFTPLEPESLDIAFLQYTSGSTRMPRGVCVTYHNTFVQIELLRITLGFTPETTLLFWMPHYHDFALIGGILNAMYGNTHLVLFSPQLFLRKPAFWFDLAHQFQATHITGPNFGYNYLIDRTSAEQRAQWNLKSIQKVICSAEPIRPKTIDRFYEAMKPSGLNQNTFCAAYGLAEHTLAASINGQKRIMHEGKEWISCGKPHDDVEVAIVDPDSFARMKDLEVGEIWLSSPHVANGYSNRPEETEQKFKNRLEDSARNWLRTGDLGFMLDQDLVCTGRIDDLIIIRGQNLYPQDIEEIMMDSNPQVRAGRVSVFGSERKDQTLVHVVVEIHEEGEQEQVMREIALKTREVLFKTIGLSQLILIFAAKGAIPKTTSGKLQRKKCRKLWEENQLSVLKVDAGIL